MQPAALEVVVTRRPRAPRRPRPHRLKRYFGHLWCDLGDDVAGGSWRCSPRCTREPEPRWRALALLALAAPRA